MPSSTLKKSSVAALMLCALVVPGLQACSSTNTANPTQTSQPNRAANNTYSENELVDAISTHLGVTAESAASVIERIFKDQGRPVGYITGEELGGAATVGGRYGQGKLWMKNGTSRPIYWTGVTVGFDLGGEASKVFTLVYGLNDTDRIFQRFPGVDGSAYFVAGMAVNYQRSGDITIVPVRTGVGLRLGANVGYTKYTKKRSYIPF